MLRCGSNHTLQKCKARVVSFLCFEVIVGRECLFSVAYHAALKQGSDTLITLRPGKSLPTFNYAYWAAVRTTSPVCLGLHFRLDLDLYIELALVPKTDGREADKILRLRITIYR